MAQRRKAFEERVKNAEAAEAEVGHVSPCSSLLLADGDLSEGNDWYRRSNHKKAAECYFSAIEKNIFEPNYYSNLAAVMIKVEE